MPNKYKFIKIMAYPANFQFQEQAIILTHYNEDRYLHFALIIRPKFSSLSPPIKQATKLPNLQSKSTNSKHKKKTKKHSEGQQIQNEKSNFPNLTLMSYAINDIHLKKSLQQIIQKNPTLAASLDLYASSNQNQNTFPNQYFKIDLIFKMTHNIYQPEKLQSPTYELAQSKLIVKEQKKKQIQLLKTYIPNLTSQTEKVYYYYLGQGNNCEVVRRVISQRPYWKETHYQAIIINFKWQQSYIGQLIQL